MMLIVLKKAAQAADLIENESGRMYVSDEEMEMLNISGYWSLINI